MKLRKSEVLYKNPSKSTLHRKQFRDRIKSAEFEEDISCNFEEGNALLRFVVSSRSAGYLSPANLGMKISAFDNHRGTVCLGFVPYHMPVRKSRRRNGKCDNSRN